MTTSPAGWYADPAGSGGQRWWNGTSWGEQVQPASQALVPPGAAQGQPWGARPAGQQWGARAPQQWAPQAPATFVKRNTASLVVFGIALVYLLLVATVHIVVLGFLPAVLAARAVRQKEPLAWPAVGVAAAVLIFAVVNFA